MSEKITIEVEDGHLRVSDGYHTLDELYEHRHALFLALCKAIGPFACVWREDPAMPQWVLVYANIGGNIGEVDANGNAKGAQISYHIPKAMLPEWMEHCDAWPWDGHTSLIVVHRLKVFAGSNW